MSRRISGSSAENGSSKSRIFGSMAKARARPTRCCMPPDSSSGYWFAESSSPTRSSMSPARSCRFAFDLPCTSRPNATLSSTRRCGSRPKCWNTIDTRGGAARAARPRARRSRPRRRSDRTRGRLDEPAQRRTSVDLPEPERPMTTNTSPGQTSKRHVPDGGDAAGLLAQLAAGEVGVRAADDPLRVRAEDLPHAVARISGTRGRRRRSGRARPRRRSPRQPSCEAPGQMSTVPLAGGDDKRDTLSTPWATRLTPPADSPRPRAPS